MTPEEEQRISDAEIGHLLMLMRKANVRVHLRGTGKMSSFVVRDKTHHYIVQDDTLKRRLRK